MPTRSRSAAKKSTKSSTKKKSSKKSTKKVATRRSTRQRLKVDTETANDIVQTSAFSERKLSDSASSLLEQMDFNAFRAHIGSWEEQPRQFLFLGFILLPLVYYTFQRDEDADKHIAESPEVAWNNLKFSGAMMAFAFLVYICLQLRDTLLVRPHPLLWRLVHGVMVIYFLVLCGLLVQNVTHARQFVMLVFDDVKPINRESDWNMQDCVINSTTLLRQVRSWWFMCHWLGWFGKMLMFRNWRICMIQSIIFEFIELSLQFVIVDFRECWWDSMFIDALGANLIGMIIGWLWLSLAGSTSCNWGGDPDPKAQDLAINSRQSTWYEEVAQSFNYFRWSRPDTQWDVFKTPGQFLSYLGAIWAPIQLELNIFLLMYTMWLPTGLVWIRVRIFFVVMIGLPAMLEWYSFASNKDYKRIGQNTWLAIAVTFGEFLVAIKFGRTIFNWVPPPEIYIPWVAFLGLFACWFVCHYFLFPMKPKETIGMREPPTIRKIIDLLFYGSFVPLLALTRLWSF